MQKHFTFFAAIFLSGLFACKSHTRNAPSANSAKHHFTVAVLPYDNFNPGLTAFVKKETEAFYHCHVTVLPVKPLPASAYYAPRNRYKADSLLAFEKHFLKNDIDAIAGLTVKDISTSKDAIPDLGIFGLGACPGKVCVISVYRLEKISATIARLQERLIKVVLHELGHNLGLPHCTSDPQCMMTDAGGSIRQVDRERKWLCPNCQLKLGG